LDADLKFLFYCRGGANAGLLQAIFQKAALEPALLQMLSSRRNASQLRNWLAFYF